MKKTLEDIIQNCWRIHREMLEDPRRKTCIVQDSIPILWFGDMEAYCHSKRKIVTVGLNPSLQEFPKDKDRFPKRQDYGARRHSEQRMSRFTSPR